MRKILYILIFVALVGFGWRYFSDGQSAISFDLPGTQVSVDQIVVESPKPGDTFLSGAKVSGKALGPWYFEASAPVKVSDLNGVSLGGGYVTALGEWMTEEFVPFSGTINFNRGNNTRGYLIFMNDNPSGEESRLKYFVVPVRF